MPRLVHSVLRRASRAQIRYDPFVHLVIEDCLPAEYYRELAGIHSPSHLRGVLPGPDRAARAELGRARR